MPKGKKTKKRNKYLSFQDIIMSLQKFWGKFGSILGNCLGRISNRFSRCVFKYFFSDFDVRVGSILTSKTASVSTPTRKGRPSIFSNHLIKILFFDTVVAAGVSTGRAPKRNNFHYEIWAPTCLQTDPNGIQNLQNGTIKCCRKWF